MINDRDKLGRQGSPLKNPVEELPLPGESDGLEADRPRNLQLLRAGSFQLAIFEDEIATAVEWRDPAPLPYAPTSVLGVVSIQGRMLTVLDLATLLSAPGSPGEEGSPHILALRGDEQLALAVDALGETIGIADGKVETAEGLFLRVFKHRNREINILNTKELFATALHGRERRRRRF
jgi:chemotaxis signal transduction protein